MFKAGGMRKYMKNVLAFIYHFALSPYIWSQEGTHTRNVLHYISIDFYIIVNGFRRAIIMLNTRILI